MQVNKGFVNEQKCFEIFNKSCYYSIFKFNTKLNKMAFISYSKLNEKFCFYSILINFEKIYIKKIE